MTAWQEVALAAVGWIAGLALVLALLGNPKGRKP